MILLNLNEQRQPFVVKTKSSAQSQFDLGPCLTKWSVEYLKSQVQQKPVKIHVSDNECMDFLQKNFIYRTLEFDELIERASRDQQTEFFVSSNEKYYLRSLGQDDRKDVADLKKQFPSLADDIRFPELFEPENFFSSVFRISSSKLRLWTHYDVGGC
jgi:tRNA wybutosine-synthesizing protein 5